MHARHTTRFTLVTRLVILIFLTLFGVTHVIAADRKPNIILILADDLGWTDPACFGSTYYETPHIDRLADEGMKFTNAYSNGPNCAPTRAALITGKYPPRNGVTQVGARERGKAKDRKLNQAPTRTSIRPEEITLAEALKSAGYATAHVGKWHLGDGTSASSEQGFDTVIGGAHGTRSYHAPYKTTLKGINDAKPGEYLTDRLSLEAVEFIRKHKAQPFFLYLAHFSVHTPIQGRADHVKTFTDKKRSENHNNPEYAAMVHSLDQSVGRILNVLDELELAENTLVIFTSDNGGHARFTSNQPLRGSKGMLYEGGVRVSTIARWPGKIARAAINHTPVISIDYYPTFLDVAGAARPEGQHLDGVSLMPILTGTGQLNRPALFWHFPHYLEPYVKNQGLWRTTPVGTIRAGRFKLMEFFEDHHLELYDLTADPSETINLADTHPEKARELHAMLKAWRAEVGAKMPTPK